MWEEQNTRGLTLRQQGRYDEAIVAYEQAIQLAPDQPIPRNNLGVCYRELGRLDQALLEFHRALELNPAFSAAHSNLVYLMWFHPAFDTAAICEEHRRWDQQHAAPLSYLIKSHANDCDKHRRLKIGYVSPTFRSHCLSFFTIPLLAHHNHQQFEINCYSDVEAPDAITNVVRSYADRWQNIAGLNDDEVADVIRQDRIDILVDMNMHMSGSRALLFARKPAPVQACWAYPGTTGLSTIDYRLTDPYIDPPGLADHLYSERSIRLPDTYWCYRPFGNEPEPNDLPALANGCVTFGSFNNYSKINLFVLKTWADVLATVPGSRLALLAPEGWARRQTLQFFADQGIAAERIIFFGRQKLLAYLELHHQIDISLDTIPYNGHTTSLDSLWMGVPVVTLVGHTVVGRAGLSLLTNLGLPGLIAHSPDQYVSIAASLASDLPRLANLRQTLRPHLQQSPLMNGPRFAAGMEAAYRQMWHTWCISH